MVIETQYTAQGDVNHSLKLALLVGAGQACARPVRKGTEQKAAREYCPTTQRTGRSGEAMTHVYGSPNGQHSVLPPAHTYVN